jgi:hypothetical protein
VSSIGTDVFDRLVGDSERSCRLVVAFSDPQFLPVSLLAVPGDCSGYQTASLRLPESLADGYASIQWYVLEASAEVVQPNAFSGNAKENSRRLAMFSASLADATTRWHLLVSEKV